MTDYRLKGIYSAIFSLYDENMNVLADSVNKLIDFTSTAADGLMSPSGRASVRRRYIRNECRNGTCLIGGRLF